jgi:hypothetical protein
MHSHRLILLRHDAALMFTFVWESIDQPCVQRMSDQHKSDGVRDRPTRGKDQFGFSPASATPSLASLSATMVSAVDVDNDAAIAQALSTGYECYGDDSPDPTDDTAELDPDYRPFPSKKIGGTDSKHKPKAPDALSADRPAAAPATEASSAAGNGARSSTDDLLTRCDLMLQLLIVCVIGISYIVSAGAAAL